MQSTAVPHLTVTLTQLTRIPTMWFELPLKPDCFFRARCATFLPNFVKIGLEDFLRNPTNKRN